MYKIVNLLLDNIQNMPVKHRRTLGDRMLDAAYVALDHVHRANGATTREERMAVLGSLLTNMNILATYLRIANERRFFSLTQSVVIFDLCNNVIKQVAGWKRYTETK